MLGMALAACGGGATAPATPTTLKSTPLGTFTAANPVYSQGITGDKFGSPSVLLYYVDINDTQPDIVTLDRTNNQVHFWRNNGSAVFSYDAVSDQTIGAGAWSLTSGNISGTTFSANDIWVDGLDRNDLLDMNSAGQVVLTLPTSTYFTQFGFYSAQFSTLGNINSDGELDAVIIEKNNPGLPALGATVGFTARVRVGFGNVGTPVTIVCSENNGNAGTYVTGRLALADLDGDTDLDLVIATFASSTAHTKSPVFVVENIGGTFASANCHTLQEFGVFGTDGLHPSGVTVADINQDGMQDIVVGNYLGTPSGGVAIYPGGGSVTGFSSVTPTFWAGGNAVNGLVVADMNNDGNLDVVAADAYSIEPKIDLFYGNGGLTFFYEKLKADVAAAALTPNGTPNFSRIEYNRGTSPIDVRVVDLDGNGKKDIVVADYNAAGADQTVVPTASTSSFTIVFQQ